jgi:hypothetical protein
MASGFPESGRNPQLLTSVGAHRFGGRCALQGGPRVVVPMARGLPELSSGESLRALNARMAHAGWPGCPFVRRPLLRGSVVGPPAGREPATAPPGWPPGGARQAMEHHVRPWDATPGDWRSMVSVALHGKGRGRARHGAPGPTMGRHTRGLALHGAHGAPWRRRGQAHRSAAAPRPVADRGIPSGGRSSGRDGPCSGRARLRPPPPDSSARAQRSREAL